MTNPYSPPISGEIHEEDGQVKYAGFWIRFAAAFIDGVIIIIVTALLVVPVIGIDEYFNEDAKFNWYRVVVENILPMIAVILLWAKFGATPGKMALGLRIIDARTGGKLSIGQSIGRYFAYIISMLPLFLGYLWVAWDRKSQAWHDKLAKTYVVRK